MLCWLSGSAMVRAEGLASEIGGWKARRVLGFWRQQHLPISEADGWTMIRTSVLREREVGRQCRGVGGVRGLHGRGAESLLERCPEVLRGSGRGQPQCRPPV